VATQEHYTTDLLLVAQRLLKVTIGLELVKTRGHHHAVAVGRIRTFRAIASGHKQNNPKKSFLWPRLPAFTAVPAENPQLLC
jgi:hypothetical protein